MSRTLKEIKYFSVAVALFTVWVLIIGALTYDNIAAITGIGEPWVAFGFVATWLLMCNRYNAHLNAELRAKQVANMDGKRLSDVMQSRRDS